MIRVANQYYQIEGGLFVDPSLATTTKTPFTLPNLNTTQTNNLWVQCFHVIANVIAEHCDILRDMFSVTSSLNFPLNPSDHILLLVEHLCSSFVAHMSNLRGWYRRYITTVYPNGVNSIDSNSGKFFDGFFSRRKCRETCF